MRLRLAHASGCEENLQVWTIGPRRLTPFSAILCVEKQFHTKSVDCLLNGLPGPAEAGCLSRK